jgi:histidyl-tRNA synthetase
MRLLFEYLEVYEVLDKVRLLTGNRGALMIQLSFDMSLARGLDYYTGIIYEAIHTSSAPPTASASSSKPKKSKNPDEIDESSVGVGSIAGGGRYDNLVGMFSEAAGQSRTQVPCVGVSVGIERVYSIMEAKRKQKEEKLRGKETEVYILALGGGLLKERMGLAKVLRERGIKVSLQWPLINLPS